MTKKENKTELHDGLRCILKEHLIESEEKSKNN